MTERELTLKIVADGSAAKTEIAGVQEAEQGLVTSTNQATAATTASTTAIQQQGDAAAQSADQVSSGSDALNDLGNTASVAAVAQQKLQTSTAAAASAATQEAAATATATTAKAASTTAATAQATAENTVVAALREVRVSMAALATASVEGGATMTAAVGRTVIAIAALEAEMKAAGGGTAVQNAALAGYRTRLTELVPAIAADTVATGAATAATNTSATAHRLQTVAVGQAAKALTGHEVSTTKVTGALLKMLGPLAGAAAGVALLPFALEAWDKATKAMSETIVDFLMGVHEWDGTVVELRKDVQEAIASSALYVAAQKGAKDATHDFTAEIETLGFKVKGSFDAAASRATDFVSSYKVILQKDGAAAAKGFAEDNKSSLEEIIESYIRLGKAVPRELQAIAKEIGATAATEKKYAEDRTLSAKWADEVSAANFLISTIKISGKTKEDEAKVVDKLKEKIRDEIKALEDLKTTNAAQEADRLAALKSLTDLAVSHGILTGKLNELNQAAHDAGFLQTYADHAGDAKKALDYLIESLDSLAKATARVDEVSEKAFDIGGESAQ
jgi:trimeric autotransporter adhesin